MIRSIALVLLVTSCLTGAVSAQPDKTAALEKAKDKFEKDVTKATETLLASIDKTVLQATKAGNKALKERLTYERPLFANQRLIPTAISTETYLQQRTNATAALLKVYQQAIAELTKAKKFDEAMALEDSLSEIVKASRGYGMAFPDLEKHPTLLIENKSTGLVIDTANKAAGGELMMTPKVGKGKPSQHWKLEREEKGFVIRNVLSGLCFDVNSGNRDAGTIVSIWPVDRNKETFINSLFLITEIRNEIVMECAVSSLILTVTEKKIKGVTNTYATQEKKEEKPLPSQLWTLVEVK
jgi:hypothetical protein